MRCYCPDDCTCRRALWNPYVVAICGCRQHPDIERAPHAQDGSVAVYESRESV